MNDLKFKPTIGLEIHAELKTKTKMFCSCVNDPDEKRPNFNVCPICTGHPGTLPVINKEAIKSVLRVGLALGGELADFTEFDRKNYFYPDIPKGYQISQYKYPLVTGGQLAGISITRVHMEEDTARSLHTSEGASLVDFNRSSLPLMELVTEPTIENAKQAAFFARELQLLLGDNYLGVSGANLEKGEMRIEANVSVSSDSSVLGTKVEIKNLNSFRSVEKAIDHEIARQIEVINGGQQVIQETRGWDETKEVTFSQRKKESSHDYRYFPDPDLPKLKLSKLTDFKSLAESIPEVPWQKRDRLIVDYGLSPEAAEVYVSNLTLAEFFEATAKALGSEKEVIKLASNYIISDIIGIKNNDQQAKLPAISNYAELITMITAKEISSRGAKDILARLLFKDDNPRVIAEENNLLQKSDEGDMARIVDQVITANPTAFAELKSGKDKSIQFLIGQGMKLSGGSANPGVLARLIKERLN